MDKLVICNEDVINYIKRNGVDSTCKYMTDKSKPKTPHKTLHKDLTRLYHKYQQLNKSKNRATGKVNYDKYMNSAYEFPSLKQKSLEVSAVQYKKTEFLHHLTVFI